MEEKSKTYLRKFNELFGSQGCDVSEDDYVKFESKKELLEKIAGVGNSALTVFDIHRMHYLLACSRFDEALGYKANLEYRVNPDFFYEQMHPEDFPFVLDTINQAVRFIQDQPPAEKLNYKLIVDYRLKNCKGVYMRFLQQLIVLETDRRGNIWLILKLFDLVSTIAGNEPSQRSLVNIKTGKKCLFDDQDDGSSSRILTKREVEILGLISQGLDSRNISDRLFISVNTVNNHRQNILSKTRSGNISQAMIYARRIGILG